MTAAKRREETVRTDQVTNDGHYFLDYTRRPAAGGAMNGPSAARGPSNLDFTERFW